MFYAFISANPLQHLVYQSMKENPQKLTQLSLRSHPRHLVGKRTAQKDTIIDITSDSQVNSNFPYRWSLASLTFNNYFYLFLYLYITWITINNNAPHLKSPKNQNRRAALGRPAIKITGGLELDLWSTNPRPWFCLGSPDKTTTNNKKKTYKTQTRSKAGSWNWRTGGLNARKRIRQIYTIDTTGIQRARRTTT